MGKSRKSRQATGSREKKQSCDDPPPVDTAGVPVQVPSLTAYAVKGREALAGPYVKLGEAVRPPRDIPNSYASAHVYLKVSQVRSHGQGYFCRTAVGDQAPNMRETREQGKKVIIAPEKNYGGFVHLLPWHWTQARRSIE